MRALVWWLVMTRLEPRSNKSRAIITNLSIDS
ncbi:Uncharacterised protein [Vibrio cholerae]|nr:Uncharacterised protein [Vibrio cholerae]